MASAIYWPNRITFHRILLLHDINKQNTCFFLFKLKQQGLPNAIGYFFKCPWSYNSHNNSCCSKATSVASILEFKEGFIAETSATTSICLVQTTGLLFTYSQDLAETPFPISWPLLSSFPLPCQVTSAVSVFGNFLIWEVFLREN